MTDDAGFSLDFSPLRRAIVSMEEGLAVVADGEWFDRQSLPVQNTLRAGVIQSFEFVYELSIKMLRRQMEAEADHPTEVDGSSFRDLLRMAGAKGLIQDVEAWFSYRQLRNITAHTYDQEKAERVYQGARVFVGEARALLNRLEVRRAG
jgi:nucleotidyltransferase substrate binding protein (TIGR01987 family)